MRAVLSANALLAFGLGVIPGSLLQICQQALAMSRRRAGPARKGSRAGR